MKLNGFSKIRKIDWISYVWLVYLPYTLIQFIPVKSIKDVYWLALSGLFLILYIIVNEIRDYRYLTIPLELLVTGIFAVFNFNLYLIIFPAWQVPWILIHYQRKYQKYFMLAYYFIIGVALARIQTRYPAFWMDSAAMGLLFPLVSPIIANIMATSSFKQHQLNQTNRRLETIIQRGERERIARDLHDTLGQSFSMITIKTELAKKLLSKDSERVSAELNDIEQTSRQNLQLVRSIVNNLHQQSLNEVLLEQGKNLATANILLLTKGETEAINWPTQIQARFGIALTEAISNILHHAKAHQVQLIFFANEDLYKVEVIDDGVGKKFVREGGNGISGMRERMHQANGEFEIYHDHHGTHVILTQRKANEDDD
ncbi:sensor histidine kinase [Liquorilactobacillus mali]|nr:sensor histidine kinase [Liquorilactobacillus mali]MDN7144779.1 sensor histidine kinase [Liquorilactobacillus mali]